MKSKKFNKKLGLNKTTVANISNTMNTIKGGMAGTSDVDPAACATNFACTGDSVCGTCASCYFTCTQGPC